MSKRKTYHVAPNNGGGWDVKAEKVSYKDVIQLLKDYLNGYAYQALSKAESALFDKHYNTEGKEQMKKAGRLLSEDSRVCQRLSELIPHFGFFVSPPDF